MRTAPAAIEPVFEETHPEEWAEYRQQLAGRQAHVRGTAGNCSGCGQFLSKTFSGRPGFPPTRMFGEVSFDAGIDEHQYRCLNTDCQPEMNW